MLKRLRSRPVQLLLGVVVSGFFLWLALRELDWSEVGAVLQRARWGYVPLVFVIWSLALAARAVRWRVMMGGRVRLSAAFHILNIGFLVNNTLPLRIGEVLRAYLIARDESDVSGWAALSTIVAERVLDVFATVLILMVVLTILPVAASTVTVGLILGAVAVAGFAALVIFAARPGWAHTLLNLFLRLLPFLKRFGFEHLLDRILDGLTPLTTWRGLAGAVLWTGISWALSVAGSWALAQIFPALIAYEHIYPALALTVVAASFSIIIPVTIASTGPFELATIFALQTILVPRELSATYALVWHAGTVLNYALWGIIGLLALGLSLGQVQRGVSRFGETASESTLPEPSQAED